MVLVGEYLAYASLLMPAPCKPLRLNSYPDEDARVNGQVRSLCRRLQAPRLPVAEKSLECRPPPPPSSRTSFPPSTEDGCAQQGYVKGRLREAQDVALVLLGMRPSVLREVYRVVRVSEDLPMRLCGVS